MSGFFTNSVPAITALSGLFGILLGFVGVILTFQVNRRVLAQQVHDEERKLIYEKLNSFYGPFQQLRGASQELYKMFKPAQDENFRTLIALLEGKKFEGNDKILLEQIIDISKKLDRLIVKRIGLVDDEKLRQLLWIANTNFRLIRLAYQGALVGDIERFKEYVFPRELDAKVAEEIHRLKQRLDELNKV